MNRRRFIVVAAMTPVAAAAAKFWPKFAPTLTGVCAAAGAHGLAYVVSLTRALESATSYRFQPGDTICLAHPDFRYNGVYRMNAERVFDKRNV